MSYLTLVAAVYLGVFLGFIMALIENRKTWLRWLPGRHGTYSTLALVPAWVTRWTKVELALLRIRKDGYVVMHNDHVPYNAYHKLAFTLWRAGRGGTFVWNARPEEWVTSAFYGDWRRLTRWWWRFRYYRPDLVLHGYTPVARGAAYVLALGWTRKDRKMLRAPWDGEPPAVT